MTELLNARVLITGAASGLGRLMARKVASKGARLVLWDINERGLESLATELKQTGVEVSFYVCDLSSRTAIYETAHQVLRKQGPVNVLINNAGVVTGKYLLDASDDEIQRGFDINTLALYWTTRAFLPAMLDGNQGHIVTISSAAGICGVPRLTDYAGSKFAAFGFDESLRLELRRQGLNIWTTIVCPYYMSTGLFEGAKTRFSWLLPILKPEVVADRVISAISKEHRRVIIPWFIYMVWPIRLLPVSWFDAAMTRTSALTARLPPRGS